MTNLKRILLASAFIVTVSVSAQAATIVDATPTTNADNDLGTVLTIGAGTVNATDIGDNAVGNTTITAGSETVDDEIVNGSVDQLDIATDGVGAAEIATGAVGTAEVADNTLTADDLAVGSVGTSEILDGTIGTADLSSGLQNRLNGFDSDIQDLKGGVASAIAIATIPGVPAGKQFAVGFGGGTYDGENAGALKLSFAPQSMQSVQVNGSVTFSDSNTGAGVGVSYGF